MTTKTEKILNSKNSVGDVINYETIAKKCRNLNVDELMALLRMDRNVFWSWGPNNFTVDNKRNTRMFRMTVQGYLHKGYVYIFVNGSDLFDVYLTTNQGTIKEIGSDLYFDDLVDWIDRHVETK